LLRDIQDDILDFTSSKEPADPAAASIIDGLMLLRRSASRTTLVWVSYCAATSNTGTYSPLNLSNDAQLTTSCLLLLTGLAIAMLSSNPNFIKYGTVVWRGATFGTDRHQLCHGKTESLTAGVLS
jgi:hypothetical protein